MAILFAILCVSLIAAACAAYVYSRANSAAERNRRIDLYLTYASRDNVTDEQRKAAADALLR